MGRTDEAAQKFPNGDDSAVTENTKYGQIKDALIAVKLKGHRGIGLVVIVCFPKQI
jgi:hypothetical protein